MRISLLDQTLLSGNNEAEDTPWTTGRLHAAAFAKMDVWSMKQFLKSAIKVQEGIMTVSLILYILGVVSLLCILFIPGVDPFGFKENFLAVMLGTTGYVCVLLLLYKGLRTIWMSMYSKPVKGVVTAIEKKRNTVFVNNVPMATVVDYCTVVWTHPKNNTRCCGTKSKSSSAWSVGRTVVVHVDPDDPQFYDIGS